MATGIKALKVSLQEDGFCIATGPEDSGIAYPCPVNPFAPVILESPVVLHLHCPELFPQQVLRIHAEHLGHFLALQNVPSISQEYECVLFQGLCRLFTRDRVICLYKETLTDVDRDQNGMNGHQDDMPIDFYQSVFRTWNTEQSKAKQTVSLVRKLLELFDLKELSDEVTYTPGEEPQHLLFLYLIQILVIYVSRFLPSRDLATIMSVASAPFLEANFCDPLCAATILKPMFIPYFENVRKSSLAKGEYQGLRYGLFKGYEIDNKGSDMAQSLDGINWTHPSMQARIQGPKLSEKQKNKLWFVAPQFGDRMEMVSQEGQKMMGGQTGEKPLKICQYLMSDNFLAYLQCVLFGTIYNMLPCHNNSEFTEDVMSAIDYSMSRFAQELCRQSSNLMKELRALTGNCLDITGVGFSGQDKGSTLFYGNVFTGPDEMRPATDPNKLGLFTSVMLGLSDKTLVSTMLNTALRASSECTDLKDTLSTRHKPVAIQRTISDIHFFARYHKFNAGEFTEICSVKPMSDPNFKPKIHKDSLTKDSKYQLTVAHGALPMCTLTLVMTMRQVVMMVMGLLCAELARTIYKTKVVTDNALCKAVSNLNMPAKFRHKDETKVNVFHARYGDTLKLTGQAFRNPGKMGINYNELDCMEWLQESDTCLPSYITNALNKIGDVKTVVKTLMRDYNLCYNRVLFLGPFSKMKFSMFLSNRDYTIHAPMMVYSSIKIFAGESSFGGLKLSRVGSYYPVKVYSNSCVNTKLHNNKVNIEENATLIEIIEKIKEHVSGVKPRIDISRLKMMAPELNQDQFESLVLTLENMKITVLGERNFGRSQPSESSLSGKRRRKSHEVNEDDYDDDDNDDLGNSPRNPETSLGVTYSPEIKIDNDLTICESDMDFNRW